LHGAAASLVIVAPLLALWKHTSLNLKKQWLAPSDLNTRLGLADKQMCAVVRKFQNAEGLTGTTSSIEPFMMARYGSAPANTVWHASSTSTADPSLAVRFLPVSSDGKGASQEHRQRVEKLRQTIGEVGGLALSLLVRTVIVLACAGECPIPLRSLNGVCHVLVPSTPCNPPQIVSAKDIHEYEVKWSAKKGVDALEVCFGCKGVAPVQNDCAGRRILALTFPYSNATE
jgi:hypothetical protein